MFGEWDAPATDGQPEIGPPVGEHCIHCQEPVREGDNGQVLGGLVRHRECSLRMVMGGIGHLVDHATYCHDPKTGPDAGLTYRQSAGLVWAMMVEREEITPSTLRLYRAVAGLDEL